MTFDDLRRARDFLIDHRLNYDDALAGFTWPDVGANFNFATDWFDSFARGNDTPGLVIVQDDGSRQSYSFAEPADRSDRVAKFLRSKGVGRGDAVMVMLGNQVELWESMLALTKLGAVIMPTTAAVTSVEILDRVESAAVREP
ncbi:AMP-binding protein [Aeromicrobium sp. UC242_57]|uniref:AMP-binding protein n=1 Tax=Aeromicrobium sp. UC242_57 TaxID=3374624 RepID=UPI0037BD7A72